MNDLFAEGPSQDFIEPVGNLPYDPTFNPLDLTRIYAFNQFESGRAGYNVGARVPMGWKPDIEKIMRATPEYENMISGFVRDSIYKNCMIHKVLGVPISNALTQVNKLQTLKTEEQNFAGWLKDLDEQLTNLKEQKNRLLFEDVWTDNFAAAQNEVEHKKRRVLTLLNKHWRRK